MKRKYITWMGTLFLICTLAAGCSVKSSEGNPSGSPADSGREETLSDSAAESGTETVPSSGPEETDTAGTDKDTDILVSYEKAKAWLEDKPVTIECRFIKGGYEEITNMEEYKEIEEVLAVYFRCYLYQEDWWNDQLVRHTYDFIDEDVTSRWKSMYGDSFPEASVTFYWIFYHDEEKYIIEVLQGAKTECYRHFMELEKADGQWHVRLDMAKELHGEFSEGDKSVVVDLFMDGIESGRREKPLTEELIQQGIEAAIDHELSSLFTGTMPQETLSALRPQLEGLYEESLSDKLLIECILAQDSYPNFNEPALVVWVHPKEGYDPALQDAVDRIFGSTYPENPGRYFTVHDTPQEGWKAAPIGQFDPAPFDSAE